MLFCCSSFPWICSKHKLCHKLNLFLFSCTRPLIVMPTPCCFLSAAERLNQTWSEGEASAGALREDKHTHYSVSSTKQLQLKRPLDRLISERSWRGWGPRWRKLASAFVSSHFLRKTKKEKKEKKKTPDTQSRIVPAINRWLIALCKRCPKSEGKEIRE